MKDDKRKKTRMNFTIRNAKQEDVELLVMHHSLMFKEIFSLQSEDIDEKEFFNMEKAYREKIDSKLSSGEYAAWIIENNNEIIGSGATSICSMVPVPKDPTYKAAYIHSIYTDKKYRRKGIASKIIQEIKKYCKENGITKMFLSASDAGRSVYDAQGFKSFEFMGYNSTINHK